MGLVLLVMLVTSAAPAVAHASLVRVVPGDGTRVDSPPSRVSLVFDENVRAPSTVVVTGPDGHAVQHGPVEVVDNTAAVAVRVTATGTYRVAFRVVSADGHPVTGQTSFGFRATPAPSGTDASPQAAAGGHRHAAEPDPGVSSRRVVGIVAGVALLAGLGLLTVRRLPGGLVNPRRDGSP
jgi:methionine-rich copper-binding protein CopC